jgi:hypothetical protein
LGAAVAALAIASAGAGTARAEPAMGMVYKYLGTAPQISEPVRSAAPSLHAINVTVRWRTVQPTCAHVRRGEWDWTRIDSAMQLAQSESLWVVATLSGGPVCTSRRPDGYFEPTEKWRDEWARFAAKTANRYGPGGTTPVLRAVEPWNEPNLHKFSGTAAAYRALFLRTESAIRRANPGVKTLAGATALCCEHSVRWLNRLYANPKMRRRGDAVSVHTYAPNATAAIQRLARATTAVPKGAGIWITEHGWSTCADPQGEPLGKCVTPPEQAAFMWEYFTMIFRYADALHIRAVFWFNAQDLATPESTSECPASPKHFFGLWTHGGEAKPALTAWEYMTATDLPERIAPHRILASCKE